MRKASRASRKPIKKKKKLGFSFLVFYIHICMCIHSRTLNAFYYVLRPDEENWNSTSYTLSESSVMYACTQMKLKYIIISICYCDDGFVIILWARVRYVPKGRRRVVLAVNTYHAAITDFVNVVTAAKSWRRLVRPKLILCAERGLCPKWKNCLPFAI